MDEIEFKLASNNPILIAHGFSKILEIIKKKIKISCKNISQLPELNLLYTKCKSENSIVSSTACQAVVSLVENGLLEISPTLSQFTATLGETKNYSASINAICSLLKLQLKLRDSTENYSCPFSVKVPQHPLISVLIHETGAWRDVISQMQSLLHCNSEFVTNYMELLRPVFMYILCNPSFSLPENCRQQTWHLLLNTQGTLNLQIEILQWLRVNDSNSCINTSNMVLEAAKLAITQQNHELCEAFLLLIMALSLDLLKHKLDPRQNVNMIETILNFIENSNNNIVGNTMIGLLSEILSVTPTYCLIDMMKIGKLGITKLRCNKVIAHTLVASILPWLAYATPLSMDALDIGKDLINTITTNSYRQCDSDEFNSNNHRYCDILNHANGYNQFYSELSRFFNSMDDEDLIHWLEKLLNIPKELLVSYRLVLSGIFLNSGLLKIIKISAKLLLRITESKKNIAGYVLPLLLYKVTNIQDIDDIKELLVILPELAVSKENVPIIIRTLETFVKAGEPLKYLAINLYTKAWLVEPRCHRHLFTALTDMSQNDKTMKGNVTCAKAMKFICEYRPEHGAELVPLLSQTLNHCNDTNGSAACAMALDGISALCLSGIADVCSTWKVLSPRMNKEERPIVIKSICKFFGDIPANPVHSEEEYDKLVIEALKKLWQFACFDTTRNIEVVESAFIALSTYPINKMTLSVLPEQFKISFKRSMKGAQLLSEAEEKVEEQLNYIPSTCWIDMLENIYEPARSFAGNFLIKLISDELYHFRTGIYMWTMGEPINYKYLPEKSPSRAVGEYLRRYKTDSTPDKKKVAVECLRIYANKYLKPLPPIKWELLNNVINISDDAWDYGITLAYHQAAVSPSAKDFLSKYLTKLVTRGKEITENEFKKCWYLCKHLQDICRGVMSNALGPFLNFTVSYIVDKAIVGKDDFVKKFDQLMIQYSKSLNDDLIHHDNKTLITNILEGLLIKINVNNKIFSSLVKAMLEMPTEQIERITLPSVWPEITNEKLEKATVIRAGLILKKNNEIPLSWMNEIIKVSSSISRMHRCLLENIMRITCHLRNEKSNAAWCWDLMCRIQAVLVDSAENYSIDSVKFLCDILSVIVIVLSCDNCLVTNDELIISSDKVRSRLFPHAMAHIASTPHWKSMTRQIMEWLNFMRTSGLSESYRLLFHNALVSLKNQQCLNDLWTKYFSIRGPINL